MNTNGVRYTHTRPALIGQRYLGSTSQALRGELYTETYTGTLGPSIRSIAPVRNDQGVIVGMVAVGITQSTLTDEWLDQLPLIASIGLVAIVAALGGLWLIRRRLLRLTGGLAPGELRVMYDHHDAVLHSVKEGLVVIDDGEIALCNDEARRLLAGESGGDVGELDDMPEFLLGTEPLTDVLYVDQGRVLVVNRAPVSTRPGSTVVTIRDRTELSAAIGELDSLSRFAEALGRRRMSRPIGCTPWSRSSKPATRNAPPISPPPISPSRSDWSIASRRRSVTPPSARCCSGSRHRQQNEESP